MGRNKRVVQSTLLLLATLVAGLLTGCATPPPIKDYHVSTYKSDLGSRLDIAINYHVSDTGGIVVVDISNPRQNDLRFWLVQTSETDGQRIQAARRFYEGDKKKHQEAFKTPAPQPGIVESFYVEALQPDGKLVMKSEPVKTPLPKEGKP